MRLADYVASFFVEKGVKDCFTVVGGGAMHLNDALGHNKQLKCTYMHHEQAAAIAAEAYARMENRPAICCVTSGPGGINALNGVAGAYLDSIPMIIISGQVRYDTTVRGMKKRVKELNVRSVGDQEFDITKAARTMCKFAEMLENPEDIRCLLEKAWYMATTGRKGPVWIDIPINYQAQNVEPENMETFCPPQSMKYNMLSEEVIKRIIDAIKESKRPVIYAGGGVRLSGAYKSFCEMIKELSIPVCTYWNSIDLIENEDELYCGRGGNMGDRAGNFAVQNADLILVLGSRLSIRQVGYNWRTWAREAKVIMVDIDQEEMRKDTIHVDMKIWCDLKVFFDKMLQYLYTNKGIIKPKEKWIYQCRKWKHTYPVVTERQRLSEEVNVYAFLRTISELLAEYSITAVSNGACCVAGHQTWYIKKGTRFIINNAIASMGYGLPASIGVCLAANKRETICLEGDGSIMMNLQELQTVLTNKLPIKIFVINNGGYHSIRITQNHFFSNNSRVGIGEESGDLSFPNYELISKAFGYDYYSIHNSKEMKERLSQVLSLKGACFCEVFTDTNQEWEPKNSAKMREDGSLCSAPLEDLAPFLSREELESNMYIPLVES